MASPSERFPTLLVIAEFPPNHPDGGGALARQMLKGYPTGRLHWWSYFPDSSQVRHLPVHGFFRFPLPKRLYPYRRWTRMKAWLLATVWVPLATRHLRETIRRVQPEQIWTILHGWVIPVADAAKLVDTHRCHVSIWDYQDHKLSGPRFGASGAERMVKLVESMYRRSSSCDAVSKPMLMDLARRTGRQDAMVVHSGLEPEQFDSLAASNGGESEEICIGYAGSIVARGSFEIAVRALNLIRHSLPKPLRLEFFGASSHRAESWFDPGWMREHGNLDDARFEKALRRCQWGLVVMDLSDDNPRYNRFSLPNKFGTYISAGLPLLVVGHQESCAVRLACEFSLGLCSGESDPATLGGEMETILRTSHPRERFRPAILGCARSEFDSASTRQALWRRFGVMD